MKPLWNELSRWRRSPISRNASWLILGRGLGFVLQALYFVLLARLLGIVEYGIYAGAFAFVAIVSSYSGLGGGSLFLRYVSVNTGRFSVYWGNIVLTAISGGAVVVTLLHVAAPHI